MATICTGTKRVSSTGRHSGRSEHFRTKHRPASSDFFPARKFSG